MEWFKNNWLIVVIVAVIGLGLLWKQYTSSSLYDKLIKDYAAQSVAHKEELKQMQQVNEEWKLSQSKLNDKYEEDLRCIEEDFNKQLNKIASRQRDELKKIVNAAKKDPATLTEDVRQTFGIPVYKGK